MFSLIKCNYCFNLHQQTKTNLKEHCRTFGSHLLKLNGKLKGKTQAKTVSLTKGSKWMRFSELQVVSHVLRTWLNEYVQWLQCYIHVTILILFQRQKNHPKECRVKENLLSKSVSCGDILVIFIGIEQSECEKNAYYFLNTTK